MTNTTPFISLTLLPPTNTTIPLLTGACTPRPGCPHGRIPIQQLQHAATLITFKAPSGGIHISLSKKCIRTRSPTLLKPHQGAYIFLFPRSATNQDTRTIAATCGSYWQILLTPPGGCRPLSHQECGQRNQDAQHRRDHNGQDGLVCVRVAKQRVRSVVLPSWCVCVCVCV